MREYTQSYASHKTNYVVGTITRALNEVVLLAEGNATPLPADSSFVNFVEGKGWLNPGDSLTFQVREVKGEVGVHVQIPGVSNGNRSYGAAWDGSDATLATAFAAPAPTTPKAEAAALPKILVFVFGIGE